MFRVLELFRVLDNFEYPVGVRTQDMSGSRNFRIPEIIQVPDTTQEPDLSRFLETNRVLKFFAFSTSRVFSSPASRGPKKSSPTRLELSSRAK